jgi:hypothetical protein
VPSRGTDVGPGAVTRLDLAEVARGTTVRVRPRDPSGRRAAAQAVLIAGPPRESGTFGSLLASEAIILPDPASDRTVLPRVPPGVYTLLLIQGVGEPVRAARDPVQVTAFGGELEVDVEVAAAAPRG